MKIIQLDKPEKMTLKDHPGFKRLERLIALVSVVVTYIYLVVNEKSVSDDEAFVEFPFLSVVFGLLSFGLIRGIYWVIDGFRKQNDDIDKEPSHEADK